MEKDLKSIFFDYIKQFQEVSAVQWNECMLQGFHMVVGSSTCSVVVPH